MQEVADRVGWGRARCANQLQLRLLVLLLNWHFAGLSRRLLRRKTAHSRQHDLVDVTPAPVFTGLEGLNNWMMGFVEMFRRMLVLGRIAASHVAAS
jgi:hypothetical protein